MNVVKQAIHVDSKNMIVVKQAIHVDFKNKNITNKQQKTNKQTTT